ncbi:MAG: hypothetical protein Q8N79_03430 [Candidatus Methanoperedens sp.]|nr:hypothetical protein [Candidatus Methanoperedens sp.]
MKIRLEIEGKNAGSVNYKGADCAELAVNYLNSIEADEVYIHLVKDDGTRAQAEFSGKFFAISATKFIMSAVNSKMEPSIPASFSTGIESQPLTLKERLEMFLRFEYPRVWFSSLDVKRRYESVYGKINLSTVSTYLARMYRDNILERKGNRNQREYHFNDEIALHNMEEVFAK